MTQMRFLVVALLATIAWTGMADGAFYFDIWPTTADGSQNTYPGEGYAIRGDGYFRFAKARQHYGYFAFDGKSDGPDGIPEGRSKQGVNDKADGILLADWLTDKKAFHASFYWHNATSPAGCDPYANPGDYFGSPVTMVGFRVANDGLMNDRGSLGNGFGSSANYDAPLLEGGENAPGAWRMGAPYVDRAGVLGYSQQGDINESDPQHEYYKISMVDSRTALRGQEVKVGSAGFGTAGFGGNSTNVPGMSGSSNWAFTYLMVMSDAMLLNSQTMTEADCTGFYGEQEPRDFSASGTLDASWTAKVIDRCIIQALVTPNDTTGIIECKGLVAAGDPTKFSNTQCDSRDQNSGFLGPYLAITATVQGDIDNDGACDVVDLLYLVDAFGSATGDANFNGEGDFNCDGFVDVVDLLFLVENFGRSLI